MMQFVIWSLLKGDDGRLWWGWEASYSNTGHRSHNARYFSCIFLTLVTLHWLVSGDTWWMLSLRLESDDCPVLHIVPLHHHTPVISRSPHSSRLCHAAAGDINTQIWYDPFADISLLVKCIHFAWQFLLKALSIKALTQKQFWEFIFHPWNPKTQKIFI